MPCPQSLAPTANKKVRSMEHAVEDRPVEDTGESVDIASNRSPRPDTPRNGTELVLRPSRGSFNDKPERRFKSRVRPRGSISSASHNSETTDRRRRVSLAHPPDKRDFWQDSNDDLRSMSVTPVSTGIEMLDAARRFAKLITQHRYFDAAIGAIILLNMVCISVEQHFVLAQLEAPVLKASEHLFLAVYVVELILRFTAGGRAVFKDNWVKFDCAIVSVSMLNQLVLAHTPVEEFRLVVVMRLSRLARLARAARLIIDFRELWILVNGLVASAGIMWYTCALIFLMLFGFSLVGVELIAIRHGLKGTSDSKVDKIISSHFDGTWYTMLTLTQFVTLDSIAAIYRPLVEHDPMLAVYFIAVFLAMGILLMNLVTAVCVNEALEQAQQNKELKKHHVVKQKKKALTELRDMFHKMDENSSGGVGLEEILNSTDEDLDFIRSFVKDTDIREVFHILDIDGDGSLDVDEFCEGLWQTLTTPTPLDFKRIDKRVESIRMQVQELHAMQCELLSKFNEVSQQLSCVMPSYAGPVPPTNSQTVDPKPSYPTSDAPILADDVLRELRDIAMELKLQIAEAHVRAVLSTRHPDSPPCPPGNPSHLSEDVLASLEICTRAWQVPVERDGVRIVRPTGTALCHNIGQVDLSCSRWAHSGCDYVGDPTGQSPC